MGLSARPYLVVAKTERGFNAREFIRRDLKRPFFESSGFCHGIAHYGGVQGTLTGINFPAYLTAGLLRNGCLDTLTTPRGQIFTFPLVLLVWYLSGASIRRFAHGRWRDQAHNRVARFALRVVHSWCVVLAVLAIMPSLLSLLLALSFGIAPLIQFAGILYWTMYFMVLSAERLREWPFAQMQRWFSQPDE